MYKKKSFSMIGVLMATVIFLLVSSVIVENMVFLIRTNYYKKYFLVGNYLANEGVEVTKAILNRNIEQELAKNTIDNPQEYTNAKLRWQIYWDEGISPKDDIFTTPSPSNTEYRTYDFTLGDTTDIIENRFTDMGMSSGTFESSDPDNYNDTLTYQLRADITSGYIQGVDPGITFYRQIDIIGRNESGGNTGVYDSVSESSISLNTDTDALDTFFSPQAIEVLSTVTLVDSEGRKYLYQVRELIKRPDLYN